MRAFKKGWLTRGLRGVSGVQRHALALESLEPRMLLSGVPDLALHFVSINLPDTAVPGDSGSITVTIENVGTAPATHKTCINIWLVAAPPPPSGDPGGVVYNAGGFNAANSEKIVDGLEDVPLNLAPGATTGPITKKFTLPDMILGENVVAPTGFIWGYGSGVHPFNMTPGAHYIVAEVDGASENEFFFGTNHQNNYAAPPQPFDYEYQFGQVGSRSNVDLNATSSAYDPATSTFTGPSADFFLSGGGTGQINVVNAFDQTPTVDNLAFTGTTAATGAAVATFKGKTGGNHIALHNIVSADLMGKLLMPGADIDGDVAIFGIAKLQLGNIGGAGRRMTIVAGSPTTITLGRVNDLAIDAFVGIASLQVTDWQHPAGSTNTINAPYLTKLTTTGDSKAGVAGDFAASLALTGVVPNSVHAMAMLNATVAGALISGDWTTSGGGIKDIKAASAGSDWTLVDSNSLSSLTVEGGFSGKLTVAGSGGKVNIGGDFTGELNSNGVITSFASIKLASAVGGKIFGTGKIGKLTAQQWSGGSITGDDFDSLSFNGDFRDATLTVVSKFGSGGIGKLSSKGSLANLIINDSKGFVASITADEWLGGSLTATAMPSLKLTGDKALGISGNLSSVTIQLSDPASKVNTISVAGFMDTSKIQAFGSIGSVTALGIMDSTISVAGGHKIDKIACMGKTTGAVFFARSYINAGTISSITLSNVAPNNGGISFGVTAGFIGKYLRAQDGKLAKGLSNLDAADSTLDTVGDYNLVIT